MMNDKIKKLINDGILHNPITLEDTDTLKELVKSGELSSKDISSMQIPPMLRSELLKI